MGIFVNMLAAIPLFGGFLLMSGCVAHRTEDSPPTARMTVTGQVLSMAEVSIFEGDVLGVDHAYVIEQQGNPGVRLVVIGDMQECATDGGMDTLYRLQLERRKAVFGLYDAADEALTSDLFIVACEAMPDPAAPALQPH